MPRRYCTTLNAAIRGLGRLLVALAVTQYLLPITTSVD